MTFVAALRCDKIEVSCVFGGPINAGSFPAYVTHVLAPMLKPRDIVVLDKLSSHKGKAVRRIILAADTWSIQVTLQSTRSLIQSLGTVFEHQASGGRATALARVRMSPGSTLNSSISTCPDLLERTAYQTCGISKLASRPAVQAR